MHRYDGKGNIAVFGFPACSAGDMMRVLVTRASPAAEKTATRLQALGHEAVIVPLSAIEPTRLAVPTRHFDALVVTSANALRSITHDELANFLPTPLYAVGKSTAAAARASGFTAILEGTDDSAALANLIVRQMPRQGKILYLAGEPRKPILEEALKREGFLCTVHLAYCTVHAETAPDSLIEAFADGRIDAVLHYSKESARTFVRLIREVGLVSECCGAVQLCLSADIASSLDGLDFARIAASIQPTEDAILALLDQEH